MGFFKNLFSSGSSEPTVEKIETYADFWNWFSSRASAFHKVVRERGEFERDFFDHVTPRLHQLNDGLFLLSGMSDMETAELIITPDGVVKNIVFAEEIVESAPQIPGWKFTSLKPEAGEGFDLQKGEIKIGSDSLRFIANESWDRPDEVDISFVHPDVTEQNRSEYTHAIHLFLDTYLGELVFITALDAVTILSPDEASLQSSPLSELKPYLAKREAAFVEKYEGQRVDTENDAYASFEGETNKGMPIVGVMNTSLLMWDSKASHPWIGIFEIGFKGNQMGLADNETYDKLDSIENKIVKELRDVDGHLNIGRQTSDGVRTIFFACKDFRLPSKVFHSIQSEFSKEFEIDFGIFKDKYWQTFDRFLPVENDDHVN